MLIQKSLNQFKYTFNGAKHTFLVKQIITLGNKKKFLRDAKLVRSNLGYIRCAKSDNEVIFIRLALVFEISHMKGIQIKAILHKKKLTLQLLW